MYVDTHTHLYSEEFGPDRPEVIGRALEAGVRHMILPDIDRSTRPAMLELAAQYPACLHIMLGIHPTSVNASYREELSALEKALSGTPACGIGECGIDLYWDKTHYKEQIKVLDHQLHLAKELNLPVAIHSRDSLPEVFAVLERQHANLSGVLHCFPGTAEDAARAKDLGFLLGIGGVVTFKNNLLGEAICPAGLPSLVLETDAPYLAPVPYRGKRNESARIPLIAQKIAELFQTDPGEIERITTENALRLFPSLQAATDSSTLMQQQ